VVEDQAHRLLCPPPPLLGGVGKAERAAGGTCRGGGRERSALHVEDCDEEVDQRHQQQDAEPGELDHRVAGLVPAAPATGGAARDGCSCTARPATSNSTAGPHRPNGGTSARIRTSTAGAPPIEVWRVLTSRANPPPIASRTRWRAYDVPTPGPAPCTAACRAASDAVLVRVLRTCNTSARWMMPRTRGTSAIVTSTKSTTAEPCSRRVGE